MSGKAVLSTPAADVGIAHPVVEFVRAVNAGDIDAAVAQLAPDAVHHTRVSDYRPDRVRMVFTMLRQVFPDLQLEIREQEVRGERVVSRITATGTHRGSFLGRSPTGEKVSWRMVDIAEVDDRRVVERHWDLWNDPELYRRIGFVPRA